MTNRRTALILQGGGALGAYEYGAIKALYEQPGFSPDIVTGVSIGAITAAILVGARGDPMETLQEMWDSFSGPGNGLIPREFTAGLSIFGTQGMYHVRPSYLAAPFLATSIYDVTPLYDSLERWVDFERLNRSETLCIVTATDIASGTLVEFSNRATLTAPHIVASASLPPAFPMTMIDGRGYWIIAFRVVGRGFAEFQRLEGGLTGWAFCRRGRSAFCGCSRRRVVEFGGDFSKNEIRIATEAGATSG